MRRYLTVLATLALAGCSTVDADIIRALASSARSWCASVTTIYGTLKMGGTGLPVGKMNCNGEGWSLDANAPAGMAQTGQVLPNGVILLPPPAPEPKLYQQDPPTYSPIKPSPAPPGAVPSPVPSGKPTSWRDGFVRDVLETSYQMQRRE